MNHRPKVPYPSDLTDGQWARLEPSLPPPFSRGRHRSVPLRDVANAISYRWETGCVWRMLPHDFPPWGTVYAYFRAWQRAGVIRQLREIVLEGRMQRCRPFSPRTPKSSTRRGEGSAMRSASTSAGGFSPPIDRSRVTGDVRGENLPDGSPT